MSSILDMEIGIYILRILYEETEFDLIDAYSVILSFIPPNYIISREAYMYAY